MYKAYFRFYEELNDFLPPGKRKIKFEHQFVDKTTVKDMIESIGVPHVEIDLILVNGNSVDFNYHVVDRDSISVYPVFESLDITDLQHLRPKPLRIPKFILDVHLGKLAKLMRLFGFDSFYDNYYSDEKIVSIALEEKRAILTRDKGLLKRNEVDRGYWLRSTVPEEQLVEVIRRFDLLNEVNEFSRCIECNTILGKIEKNNVIDCIPEKAAKYYDDFTICRNCDKIFWPGCHHDKMKEKMEELKKLIHQ